MKRASVALLIALFNILLLMSTVPTMAASKERPQLQSARSDRSSLAFIQERIRKHLATLPFYGVFDNLYFSYDGETVVLGGEVVHPTTRSEAESAVKSVEGVERVVNNIEVLPPSPVDDRIRVEAYKRIFSNPQFTRYAIQAVPPLHIIVKHARIKLEGVVASSGDKIMAGMIANQIPGVFSVENNLRVEGKY